MNKKKGWIILHRKIQDNYLWESTDKFDVRSAWIDLLLMASHEERVLRIDGQTITIKAGQRITSLGKLAERWHWNRKTVKKYLDELQNQGMITYFCTNRWTSVFIVNYSKYQLRGSADWTAEWSAERTSERTSDWTQSNNYRNNYRNNEEIKEAPPRDDWEEVIE